MPRSRQVERDTNLRFDGVYDIETQDWDTFVVGGLIDTDGNYYESWDEEKFFDVLCNQSGSFWGHNAGVYDVLWFLRHARSRKMRASIVSAGQRLISVELHDRPKGKPLKLQDSYALIPIKLSKASEIGDVRKIDTNLPCVCGDACGGYCSIRRDADFDTRKKISEYLQFDCRATLSMLRRIGEYGGEHSISLSQTVGATSWRTAQRELELPPSPFYAEWLDTRSTRLYSFCRKGYYGGRVQVFKPYADRGFQYDINSAYPHALTDSVPCGIHEESVAAAALADYMCGKPGIYQALVEVPDMYIPPLPLRTKRRLYYPTGRFEGHFTDVILRYAETLGVRIITIRRAVTWERRESLIEGFCRRIYELRKEAGSKSALGEWLKFIANSFTGKCAQSPERDSIVLDFDKEPTYCPASFDCELGRLCEHGANREYPCCRHQCNRRCGRWDSVGDGIWSSRRFILSPCSHIEWAAYLTSRVHVKLHSQLVSGGGKDAVYCDTDSVFALKRRWDDIGLLLGQWKEEGEFLGFEAIAPKVYHYINWTKFVKCKGNDCEECKGKGCVAEVARCKGIEKALNNWQAIALGAAITSQRGVKGFRTAARDGNSPDLFVRKSMTRQVARGGVMIGDRLLVNGGQDTRPLSVDEIYGMEKRNANV